MKNFWAQFRLKNGHYLKNRTRHGPTDPADEFPGSEYPLRDTFPVDLRPKILSSKKARRHLIAFSFFEIFDDSKKVEISVVFD